jgi:hypothetical protein
MVTPTEAGILRIEHPNVVAGDVIVTQQCMINYGEDLSNEVLHLTR